MPGLTFVTVCREMFEPICQNKWFRNQVKSARHGRFINKKSRTRHEHISNAFDNIFKF